MSSTEFCKSFRQARNEKLGSTVSSGRNADEWRRNEADSHVTELNFSKKSTYAYPDDLHSR